MKLHYLLLFTLHLSLFSTPSVLTAQNCQDYTCNIAKARTALSHKKFKEAIDYCKAAKAYPNANIVDADAVIYQIFVAIEKEKEEAKKARDEANRQKDIAKNALAQVEIEKFKTDSLYKIAENLRKKTQAVVDRIYFYDGKFGLAYDSKKNKFGFIDKELNTTIEFKYDEVSPFDKNGFAKVRKAKTNYLIDTTGISEYKLAEDFSALDSNTKALFVQIEGLKEIPTILFNNPQLKLLQLKWAKIEHLPKEIGQLTNLIYLNLNGNMLTGLPKEIEGIQKLTFLDLTGNNLVEFPKSLLYLKDLRYLKLGNDANALLSGKGYNKISKIPNEIKDLTNLAYLDLSVTFPEISKEEQERLKKLLPNCEIKF